MLNVQGKGNKFYGRIVELSEDPLFIVDSYYIQNIEYKDDRAVVDFVDYKRLAKAEMVTESGGDRSYKTLLSKINYFPDLGQVKTEV